MDRIINNESIAICAILNALLLGVDNIARINLFTVMTSDRAIRTRLAGYNSYEDMVGRESSYFQALNRKFVEFQPVFINAATMLLMGEKIEDKIAGKFNLTLDGVEMAYLMRDRHEKVIESIIQATIRLEEMIRQKDTATWYKDLKIVL